MEALLQSSGIVTNSTFVESKVSPPEGQAASKLNDKLSNLMISDSGELKYIGLTRPPEDFSVAKG